MSVLIGAVMCIAGMFGMAVAFSTFYDTIYRDRFERFVFFVLFGGIAYTFFVFGLAITCSG